MNNKPLSTLMGAAATLALLAGAATPGFAADTEWQHVGGTKLFQRYAPLSQIDKDNVAKVRLAWSTDAAANPLSETLPDLSPSNGNRTTPLMVKGVLYVADTLGLVRALDPATGVVKWIQSPLPATMAEASAGTSMRGIEYWESGADRRIVTIRGEYLYAINADTGAVIPSFGENGRVLLRWPSEKKIIYGNTSPPIVVGDVVVVGGYGGYAPPWGMGDNGNFREAVREDVRGYDVRTGKLLWTLPIIPEEMRSTWGKESWRWAGNMGAWAPLSGDDELGYVYVPTGAPTIAYYGGDRPGDNKYANSVIAVEAKTGKIAWARQLVHHDLWDYDTASPPVLGDVKVRGKTRKVVMQLNKTGMLYVLDRKTGEPVWPIEERPVPKSSVPGEQISPTQPYSSFPSAALTHLNDDDLADFTPAMREEARALVSRYANEGVFTPTVIRSEEPGSKIGSIVIPGLLGGASWNSGAFDPDTGTFYVVAANTPYAYSLVKPPEANATVRYRLEPFLGEPLSLKSGLPLIKPPYSTLSAYDITAGKRLWSVPSGDDPAVRSAPELAGVKLPPMLGTNGRGAAVLVTKSLLFLADGRPDRSSSKDVYKLRAFDKQSGALVWETPIPAPALGAPMTYSFQQRQYIVLPVGGLDGKARWIAFTGE